MLRLWLLHYFSRYVISIAILLKENPTAAVRRDAPAEIPAADAVDAILNKINCGRGESSAAFLIAYIAKRL